MVVCRREDISYINITVSRKGSVAESNFPWMSSKFKYDASAVRRQPGATKEGTGRAVLDIQPSILDKSLRQNV